MYYIAFNLSNTYKMVFLVLSLEFHLHFEMMILTHQNFMSRNFV